MSKEKQDKRGKKVLKKLRNKYRLVLINAETFEERYSYSLTRMNVILALVGSLLVFGVLIVSALVFTPLKEYIPGYADSDIRFYSYNSSMKADSIASELHERQQYIDNLRRALNEEIKFDSVAVVNRIKNIPSGEELEPGQAEMSLRNRVEAEDAIVLTESANSQTVSNLSNTLLFPPLQGMVTAQFDLESEHFGIDVVSPNEDAVKSVLEGTVIMASWTYDTGYVIQIQHSNNLISVYKHNAVLLKKVGDRVKGGEAIAIVGNSGEYSDGPHLHFELWSDGRPVDPLQYMVIG